MKDKRAFYIRFLKLRSKIITLPYYLRAMFRGQIKFVKMLDGASDRARREEIYDSSRITARDC